jgi:hypothetical protein
LAVEGAAGVVGLTIRFTDGHTDHFVQAPRGAAKLRFLDFETDAQAIHVRIDEAGSARALLAGGTKITRAGKPVAAEVKTIEDLSKTGVRHKF